MVISHFIAMLLFAFFVSVVFGVLTRETPRDCLIYSAKTFGAFTGIALLMGWVMFAFAK
jgi:putative Mn2+ efflux pump MntP